MTNVSTEDKPPPYSENVKINGVFSQISLIFVLNNSTGNMGLAKHTVISKFYAYAYKLKKKKNMSQ